MQKFKIPIIIILFITICIVNVFVFNYISDKQYGKKEDKSTKEVEKIDVSHANNVPTIDAKLGEDIKITQGYLKNYVVKKQGIWYMSSGYVNSIIKKDGTCNVKVSNDKSNNVLMVSISSDKCNIKKNDYVNFVGTIDIETGVLKLSRIDINEINYNSATKIEINELIHNIELVRNNKFIINGFLVTSGSDYYLYDSKEDYEKKSSDYFVINWKDTFMYTGNSSITITCNLLNGYTLSNCEYNN